MNSPAQVWVQDTEKQRQHRCDDTRFDRERKCQKCATTTALLTNCRSVQTYTYMDRHSSHSTHHVRLSQAIAPIIFGCQTSTCTIKCECHGGVILQTEKTIHEWLAHAVLQGSSALKISVRTGLLQLALTLSCIAYYDSPCSCVKRVSTWWSVTGEI